MENRLTHNDVSCSVCRRPVNGNLNGDKIIICGRCVQLLLTTSQKNKIHYMDKLKDLGDLEGARSIESFIIEEDGTGMIATPSQHLPSKCLKSTFKTVTNVRQHIKEIIRKRGPIRKIAEEIGLDHGNLIRMLREESDPRIKTIERIADCLGYSLTLREKEVKRDK